MEELKRCAVASYQGDDVAKCRGELLEASGRVRAGRCDVHGSRRGQLRRSEAGDCRQRPPCTAPLVDGEQRLIIYVDRTVLEVFASDGLTYVPLPFVPKPEDNAAPVDVKGRNAKMKSLEVYGFDP